MRGDGLQQQKESVVAYFYFFTYLCTVICITNF